MKPIIFFHIATIGKYQSVVNEMMGAFISSGLYESCERIDISVAGEGVLDLWWTLLGFATELRVTKTDLSAGEAETISRLHTAAINDPDTPFLYVHTKGVSNGSDNPAIDEWRRYMTHFCVSNWPTCMRHLSNYDAVGVDWRTDPVPHFSGNFWWGRGGYLAGLKPIRETPVVLSDRHRAEFWIGTGNPNQYSMHDCGVSGYERHLHRYPMEEYV